MYRGSQQVALVCLNFHTYDNYHVRRGSAIEGHTRINTEPGQDTIIYACFPHIADEWCEDLALAQISAPMGLLFFLTGQAKMERPKISPSSLSWVPLLSTKSVASASKKALNGHVSI